MKKENIERGRDLLKELDSVNEQLQLIRELQGNKNLYLFWDSGNTWVPSIIVQIPVPNNGQILDVLTHEYEARKSLLENQLSKL